MNLVVDIADEVFRELGEPDDINLPSISFWLVSNIGQLNGLIGTNYTLDEDEEITPEVGDTEKAIFKLLYFVNYYNKLVKFNLGASAYDWSEVVEGDTQIRKVSRNEISKTLIQTKKSLEDLLFRLVGMYKQGKIIPTSLSAAHDLLRYYRI